MESFVAGLEEQLNLLATAQNSEAIRNVTSTLNSHFYTSSECVPAFASIISRSQIVHVRQLASVELRKSISKWWLEIQEPIKVVVRQQLLEAYAREPQEIVRHSLARVVSSIARIDIPENKWPELLSFLQSSCDSPDVILREAGIYCLYSLLETIEEYFMNNTAHLFQLLSRLIIDESKKVCVYSVLTLGKIAEYIDTQDESNIKSFRSMIPGMVDVLKRCLHEKDEDSASQIFEVFDTLLMLDVPLLNDHFKDLIEFFLQISSNKQLDDSLRSLSLSFLMWASIYKQNKIRSLKLVSAIVEHLMPIGAERDPEDIDEDSPSRLSFKVLNALATNMPPQQVFPIVMPAVVQYMQNPDPNYRKAGMMSFAVIIEGCAEFMSSKMTELVQLVCEALRDSEIVVRRAGCMALGCLAEELATEISEHHQVLLPLVFNLMSDTNPEVTKHACNALDAILEGLEGEVLQYLPMLMEKLVYLLEYAEQTETKATVMAAIGSAAHAAGEGFVPYFDGAMALIHRFMSLKDGNDESLLRGVATDSAGAIAEAVGADVFRRYKEPLMALAVEQLEMDTPRLRECSYAFFSTAARVFGEEFAQYLPAVMPAILASCGAEEKNEVDPEAEIDLTLGDEDEDDINAFNFNTAVADEKEFAADALGALFESTRGHFLPYMEASLAELKQLAQHLFEGVRKAVVGSLFAFLKTMYEITGQSEWTPGLPVGYAVNENVVNMTNEVIPVILEMWKEEDDRMVVVQIFQELIAALKLMGPCIVADACDPVSECVLEIFEKKSICQQALDDEDDLDEDEEAESESLLISGAADLVAALCEVVGEAYSNHFDVFLPLISKYYKKTKSSSERSMAIGCLGECITGIKSKITPNTERLFKLFCSACADEDGTVKSNAAFALGILTTHSQIDLSSQYPTMLGLLHPLFSDKLRNTVDNAAGAVARLILAHEEAMPLDQVLPVLTSVLPLKADFAENEPVFTCLFKLFSNNNPFILNHLPQFVHLFEQVLSDEEQLTDNTRAQLIELVRFINSQYGELNIASTSLSKVL